MLSYAEIKCALKAKHESTTHFTEKFFNAYIAAQENSAMWDAVKASDFYNKNSCGYCVFLEIFNDALPTFRIDIFVKDFYCDRLVSRKYVKAFNTEKARQEAEIHSLIRVIRIMEVQREAALKILKTSLDNGD